MVAKKVLKGGRRLSRRGGPVLGGPDFHSLYSQDESKKHEPFFLLLLLSLFMFLLLLLLFFFLSSPSVATSCSSSSSSSFAFLLVEGWLLLACTKHFDTIVGLLYV